MSNAPKARVVFGCGNGEVNVSGQIGVPSETLVRVVHTAQNTFVYEIRSEDAMGVISWVPLVDLGFETRILRLAFTRALMRVTELEEEIGADGPEVGRRMVPEICLP